MKEFSNLRLSDGLVDGLADADLSRTELEQSDGLVEGLAHVKLLSGLAETKRSKIISNYDNQLTDTNAGYLQPDGLQDATISRKNMLANIGALNGRKYNNVTELTGG